MAYLKQNKKTNLTLWIIVFILLTVFIYKKAVIQEYIDAKINPYISGVHLFDIISYCSIEIVVLPLILLIPFALGRSLRSFITPRARVNYVKILAVIVIYSVVVLISLIVEFYSDYDSYRLIFEPLGFLNLFIVASVLIAIKAFVVEFVYSGFLSQFYAQFSKNKLGLVFVYILYYAGSRFLLVPFEAFEYQDILFILFIGCFYGVTVLLGDGIEITIGMSFINYLLPILFVTDIEENHALFFNISDWVNKNLYFLTMFLNMIYLVALVKLLNINWKKALGIDNFFSKTNPNIDVK